MSEKKTSPMKNFQKLMVAWGTIDECHKLKECSSFLEPKSLKIGIRIRVLHNTVKTTSAYLPST